MYIQKNKIIAVGLVSIGICFGVFGFINKTPQVHDVSLVATDTYTTPLSDTETKHKPNKETSVVKTTTQKDAGLNFLKNADLLYTTFIIEEKSFRIPFLKGETILDAMTTAMNEDLFTFSGKDFSGIGFFVDTINGKKAERGKSYILWINGKKAEVGVSGYQLLAGDVISWTYEDNY